MSTPAQSKIEFAAHLIKISTQIGENICGPFRDKQLIQYFSRCDVFASTTHSKKVSHGIILAKMATNLLFRSSQPCDVFTNTPRLVASSKAALFIHFSEECGVTKYLGNTASPRCFFIEVCAHCCNGGFWEHLIFIEQKFLISPGDEIKNRVAAKEG